MSAPWRQLLQQSIRKNEHLRHSKYLQIATVRPDGRPANRTVVYRGFLWDTDRVTFVTDVRSLKVNDLAANPWAEVAWYFPETREQYRLLGQVTVVSKDAPNDDKLQRARVAAWKNMSDPGRQQFLWPHPGIPRPEEGDDAATFKPLAPTKDDPVADAFCLCVIEVEEVDLLCLKSNKRWSYRLEGGEWTEAFLNP